MEEKTGKIQRTTQSSSTTSSHGNDRSQPDTIPQDLTIEILSRLPAKSIMRFRCVSNLWSAITTTPHFISSFTTRSSASWPSVLLTVKKDDMIFVFSSPLRKNNSPDGPFSCVGSYQLTNLNDMYLRRLKYVHGLICLEDSKQFVIWNPTVKGFSTLPKLQDYIRGNDFLGYDPIDGKYKALRLLTHFKICIVTFGAQGSSRIITKGFPSHWHSRSNWRCINGVIYYGAIVSVDDCFEYRIMSFDVRTEKFNPIKYPDDDDPGSQMMIVHYEGRLAIVKKYFILSIDLWILMDGDGNEWTHKSFVLPGIDPIRREELRFNGVSDASEFVFAPWRFSESFYILYFDPRRNSIREALFEGNVGDEFRLRYGLGNIFMGYMKVFPNHIENLVSL